MTVGRPCGCGRQQVSVTLALAWMVLGQSFAFHEGMTTATTGWCLVTVGLGFVGAVLGGLVAAVIARGPTPVRVLASLVVILGLAQAIAYQVLPADDEATVEEEVGELSLLEAASMSTPPTWYTFTLPFVGMFGVLAGGSMKKRSSGAT